MEKIIRYFAERPLICNVFLFGIIAAALVTWNKIGKEEMPEFERESVRISISYPGASAEDVEQLVTKPVEDKLRGISGIESMTSAASFATSSIRVEFTRGIEDLREKIQQVKDAVEGTTLPPETEDPEYRQFNTAEKAIIDIAIFHKNHRNLDDAARQVLQEYVKAFETKLLTLTEISGIDKRGYLKPEIRIEVDPSKLEKLELSLDQAMAAIRDQHLRLPIGSFDDQEESSVSIVSERISIPELENIILRQGFSSSPVLLKDIATIRNTFQKTTSLRRVQGHEAVILNVKKSMSTDILTANQKVSTFIEKFNADYANAPVQIKTMDDESYDVKNRLSLIAGNGILGFALIVLILFIFMNLKTGFWVGIGIPFSLAFTLICAHFFGYTVNNMTLCAIIIVIGIVVDDAIIVAENIDRYHRNGFTKLEATVKGTTEVFGAVIAAILTTCAAFIPLYFFEARFGALLKYIPLVIFLMLFASLIESFLILPSHLKNITPTGKSTRDRLLMKFETWYQNFIGKVLRYRPVVITFFVLLLGYSSYLFTQKMNFTMFPREESREIVLRLSAAPGTTKLQMAKLIEPIEDMFISDGIVTAVRTRIGIGRRGGAAKEHEASLIVELIPPDQRKTSLRQALEKWEAKTSEFKEFEKIRFAKSRWGSSSGSPIEIEVRHNNDTTRDAAVEMLAEKLQTLKSLKNVEIDRPARKTEYRLTLKDQYNNRLDVSAAQLARNLRAYLEGVILYRVSPDDEEIDVRFTASSNTKQDISSLLELKTSNKQAYLIPISKLVEVETLKKPTNIQRASFRRFSTVFADLEETTKKTPLEIATEIETTVFPSILKEHPSVIIEFKGEVEESRKSTSDFSNSILLVLGLIFVILTFLYNSIMIPIVIGSVIPFGLIGVVLAFIAHDMTTYGFFAVIGTLGMIGVVVNDAIVMVVKLENELIEERGLALEEKISAVVATRLRPVILTTVTTSAGLFPTAYGLLGYDSMLAEMMLAMGWGLIFCTLVTLVLLPSVYTYYAQFKSKWRKIRAA